MKESDVIKEARERFDEIGEKEREQRESMLEDLQFSNPSGPQQWPDDMVKQRLDSEGGARPCLVFDQTNTYLNQVKNASRENKPSIVVRPFDSYADVKVAEALTGIIRHIEDNSRADIAYVTATDYSIMAGVGYFEIGTKVVDGTLNQQEIMINRIADIFSVRLDMDWQEPDGSDAMFGFIESKMSKRSFMRQYPDAAVQSFSPDSKGWFDDDFIKIAKYYNITETKRNMLVVEDPVNPDQEMMLSEQDYWMLVQNTGHKPVVTRTYWDKKRKVSCYLMSGEEVLDESEFPASYVPIIPIVGNDLFVQGKRHLSGMIRAMKDPQRAYNYERNNYIEHVSLQNKIPYMAAAEAIEGYENEWRTANSRNIGVLPYNHVDSNDRPLPVPSRQAPPAASSAYVQGAQMALADLQASIGMFQANIGKQSNETSGRAIDARKQQGETSSFHYLDNRNRSIKHAGKIIVEMIPRVYDTKRMIRILGEDGTSKNVTLDPGMPQASSQKNGLLAAFNPSIGTYDVSIQVGPAFGTRRQEALQSLQEMVNGNPQIFAVLGDQIAKLSDMPDADKIAKRLKFLQPPEMRAAEDAENAQGESPEISAMKAQMQKQMQEMQQQSTQVMQAMEAKIEELQDHNDELEQGIKINAFQAQNDLQKENVKAQASVQEETIRAEALVRVAEIEASKALPMEHQPQQPHEAAMQAPPVQIFNGDQRQSEINEQLIERVDTLANLMAEQNGHLFLAVSAIADKLTVSDEPKHMQGKMVRSTDGSYVFEAVKS